MTIEPLRFRFWPAFAALVEDEIANGRLDYAFGHKARCGERTAACDYEALSRAVRQQIGRSGWPIEKVDLLDREILTLTEFFAGSVVEPAPLMCGYCEQYHIAFGHSATDDFALSVNGIFRSLALPMRFDDGKLIHDRSVVLSRAALEIGHLTNDTALLTLIATAVDDFFDGGDDRRWSGLEKIVDAFERTKALLSKNKRESVTTLINRVSPHIDLVEPLAALFRQLTEIGNQYSIRHHEPSQQPLTDPSLVEFLFFSYFNLVRFALTRLRDVPPPAA